MKRVGNTLYLLTQGAYLNKDHQTLQVRVDGKVRLTVPRHHLDSIVCFGRIMVSPSALAACGEEGIAVSFLSPSGRFRARLSPPVHGNVLLRRQQYRLADDESACLALARPMIAAKIQNARAALLRAARDGNDDEAHERLNRAAGHMAAVVTELPRVESLNAARGIEGETARTYFGVFADMIREPTGHFAFSGRNRRPPRDSVNAMLSFHYALLLHDVSAALQAIGLDPAVGFLHADRPGRLSLALDVMEEFRPLVADRQVTTLINRRQVKPNGFVTDPAGSVRMDEKTRRAIVTAYQQRKQEEVTHPLLGERLPIGLLPHIQARLLARTLRGDFDTYPALVLR